MKRKVLTCEVLEKFKKHLISEEKSTATIKKYMHDVFAFSKYVTNGEITKKTVIEYKKHLQENYSVRSVNSMLASLNSFFSFIHRYELRVKSIKLQQPIYCLEEKELTKPEYIKLCKAAEKKNHRLNLIIQTICSTGIRISELKYITVENVRSGELTVTCKSKTRAVFIVKELKKKLLFYAATQKIKKGMIFVTRNGNPINRSNIWREMKALCSDAGLNPKKVFPHNLRHLFARVFYNIEKDISKLADILGHSNINTTRIYIVSTGLEHRRKMEKLQLII